MSENCPTCGREKTWEHDALCFACLPTGDVQTEIDALRDELDKLDLRIRRHARALDRLRQRRRSLADRLRAWEKLADENPNCSTEEPSS